MLLSRRLCLAGRLHQRSVPLMGRGAGLPPRVALVASEHNQMSWPRGDHTPQARDALPSARVARASASPDPLTQFPFPRWRGVI